MVQATWTFIPVVLCFPEYSSWCPSHDQHGSSVPSRMYWASGSRSSGRHKFARRFRDEWGYSGYSAADSRLGDAERLADFRLGAIMPHVGQCGHCRFEKTEARRPIRRSCLGLHGVYPDAEVDDFFAVEPGGMMHVMACSMD